MKKLAIIFFQLCFLQVLYCCQLSTSDTANPADQMPAVTETGEKSLVVFCGAGLREPMDKITGAFEKKEG